MSMTIQSSVKDKILVTSSKTSKECEIRYHPGKANGVAMPLSGRHNVLINIYVTESGLETRFGFKFCLTSSTMDKVDEEISSKRREIIKRGTTEKDVNCLRNLRREDGYVKSVPGKGVIIILKERTFSVVQDLFCLVKNLVEIGDNKVEVDGCFFSFGAVTLYATLMWAVTKVVSSVYVCVYVDYVGVGTQSIKRDRLIGIGVVLVLVEFISFTFE
ncbi:hypothetical protein Tco_0689522 [Tanacetum coccineum]